MWDIVPSLVWKPLLRAGGQGRERQVRTVSSEWNETMNKINNSFDEMGGSIGI
jgi:hypothetical protein